MADRKAELEKKRKKLDELRKARELKKAESKDKEIPKAAPDPLAKEREDVNKLVSDLIGGGAAPASSSSKSPTPKAAAAVGDSPAKEPQKQSTTPGGSVGRSRPVKHLVVDQLAPVNIRPREVEVYAKQTQTDIAAPEQRDEEDEETEIPAEPIRQDTSAKNQHKDDTIQDKPTPTYHSGELSQEQLDRILVSDDFKVFVDRTTRLVERALCDNSDILFDYLTGANGEGGESLASMKVVKKKVFLDERWSRNRNITSMDWSTHHPELVLVGYYTNPNVPHDPDGVALMWDLKFHKETPDYIFNCQSPVMSVAFSKFHPNYIIGGTYSGQIVLWDTRSGKRTPIQRSPLSSSAHTHPIYSLDVVGSQNAHNLISVSTDGKMCSWNLDMLSQPQESLDLQNRQARPVAVTCMSFFYNDVNKFLVGSEECLTFQGQRHGTKPGLSIQFDGHMGPITSVSSHRAAGGQVDLSHLFVTSSFDWTIKLWSSRLQNEMQLTSKVGTPLCSFDNNSEYVYDVQWSPVHPAVFTSADGEGKLDFWNINTDTEVPLYSENLGTALSKLCWSPNGQYLTCGDIEGKVHLFETGEGLCAPHADEWTKMQQTLMEFQENQDMMASLS